MASVTSDHVVTGDLEFTFTGCVTDRRPIHEMSLHARDRRVEVERSATHNTRRDQVLHDFLLSVDGNGATVVKLAEGDAVRHAVETKLDTVMDEPLSAHPRTHAGFLEEVGNAVFDDARSNPLLHVVEAPGFQDDGVDALALEEVAEQEPRRTGADDHHLRAN